jgi:hypothetical protein
VVKVPEKVVGDTSTEEAVRRDLVLSLVDQRFKVWPRLDA